MGEALMAVWSWQTTSHRGVYTLRRDDVEVATVHLLPDVWWHSLRLDQICAAMADVDVMPGRPDMPSWATGVDWAALGWVDFDEFAANWRMVVSESNAVDDHVRAYLKDAWADKGWQQPISREQLVEWRQVMALVLPPTTQEVA